MKSSYIHINPTIGGTAFQKQFPFFLHIYASFRAFSPFFLPFVVKVEFNNQSLFIISVEDIIYLPDHSK
jgi:hypothetical protein